MTQEPMVLTAVYLPTELREAAKDAARDEGYGSMAEVVRQALTLFFADRLRASKQETSNQ